MDKNGATSVENVTDPELEFNLIYIKFGSFGIFINMPCYTNCKEKEKES